MHSHNEIESQPFFLPHLSHLGFQIEEHIKVSSKVYFMKNINAVILNMGLQTEN